RCDAMRCDAMRCDAMRCDAMRCDAMRCDAMRCDAMRCDAKLSALEDFLETDTTGGDALNRLCCSTTLIVGWNVIERQPE
ncbi:MAG: hypothetical protein ACR2GH_11350, partial [Pseudonocardia sp.]